MRPVWNYSRWLDGASACLCLSHRRRLVYEKGNVVFSFFSFLFFYLQPSERMEPSCRRMTMGLNQSQLLKAVCKSGVARVWSARDIHAAAYWSNEWIRRIIILYPSPAATGSSLVCLYLFCQPLWLFLTISALCCCRVVEPVCYDDDKRVPVKTTSHSSCCLYSYYYLFIFSFSLHMFKGESVRYGHSFDYSPCLYFRPQRGHFFDSSMAAPADVGLCRPASSSSLTRVPTIWPKDRPKKKGGPTLANPYYPHLSTSVGFPVIGGEKKRAGLFQ